MYTQTPCTLTFVAYKLCILVLVVADDRHVPAAQHDHLLSARLAQRDWILAHIWCSYAQNLEVSALMLKISQVFVDS